MSLLPGFCGFLEQENADSVGELAVRGDVENVLRGRSLGIAGEGRALADKIVLVDVAWGAGVGLHATNGHGDIMHSQNNEPQRAQRNMGDAVGLSAPIPGRDHAAVLRCSTEAVEHTKCGE